MPLIYLNKHFLLLKQQLQILGRVSFYVNQQGDKKLWILEMYRCTQFQILSFYFSKTQTPYI